MEEASWNVITKRLEKRYSKWLIGLLKIITTILYILFTMKNKIRMYIWLLFEMKES